MTLKKKTYTQQPPKILETRQRKSKFQRAELIGVDGEAETFIINGKEEKIYNLLQDSEGQLLRNNEGITFWQVVDFFYNMPKSAIIVIFGGNYDMNMWLLRGIPRVLLEKLYYTGYCTIQNPHTEEAIRIHWLRNKKFVISKSPIRIYNKDGSTSVKWKESRVIYDTLGFFQGGFEGVFHGILTLA